MFVSMISMKRTLIYAVYVISRQHFHEKNIGRIKVNKYFYYITKKKDRFSLA